MDPRFRPPLSVLLLSALAAPAAEPPSAPVEGEPRAVFAGLPAADTLGRSFDRGAAEPGYGRSGDAAGGDSVALRSGRRYLIQVHGEGLRLDPPEGAVGLEIHSLEGTRVHHQPLLTGGPVELPAGLARGGLLLVRWLDGEEGSGRAAAGRPDGQEPGG